MKLTEIADISTGFSFRTKIKHDPSGDTKVIQMGDVDKYRGVMPEKLQSISGFDPRSNRYFLSAGDVIMVSKGYNMNAFIVPVGLGKAVTVNSFIVMKPDIDRVLPEYLVWFLNSKRTQHFFTSIAAGTSVPNLSIKALEALDIELPSGDAQGLIAELDNLKRREVSLHQKIATKKEQLVDEMLQQHVDNLKTKQFKDTKMSKKKNYDVSPKGDKWQVKKHNASRASKTYDTQKDAIDYGRDKAKKSKGELYIKNRKGQVRDANSYGKDPYPPKG